MTSLHLFLLILLMRVAHFLYIVTSIITYGTFKAMQEYFQLGHHYNLNV